MASHTGMRGNIVDPLWGTHQPIWLTGVPTKNATFHRKPRNLPRLARDNSQLPTSVPCPTPNDVRRERRKPDSAKSLGAGFWELGVSYLRLGEAPWDCTT